MPGARFPNSLYASLQWIAALCICLVGCTSEPIPKPRGYYRIELPEKKYSFFETPCHVGFDVPNYSKLEMLKSDPQGDSCWFNLAFPRFNARLHCTYVQVNHNFSSLVEDAYAFAAKHEVKASALKRTPIHSDAKKVYGILYDIEGEAASQVQFFVSDSTEHFLRGALYFFNPPNADSIAPVLDFLKEDIIRLTQSLQWLPESSRDPANDHHHQANNKHQN